MSKKNTPEGRVLDGCLRYLEARGIFHKDRELMSVKERREAAAYYLEGIKSGHSKTDK
jgi:hypothetical protein